MVAKATPFETLRVLHNLWKKGHLDTSRLKYLLLAGSSLQLTVLANGEIKAQSLDGQEKYSINQ